VTPDPGPPAGFNFNSPIIDADASMHLTGVEVESVANWTLGFIQLKYIGTNHARYRGATVREGSALVTHSNQILCRDTDIGSAEVWYDSLNAGGTTGPFGTNKLAAGTVLPPTRFLEVVHTCSTSPPAGGPSFTPTRLFPAARTTSCITPSLNCSSHHARGPGSGW
jgi:hypothetical protein